MASSDLIVKVRMEDLARFQADAERAARGVDGIGRSGSAAGRIGSAGIGVLSRGISKLVSTAKWGGLALAGFGGFVATTGIGFNAAFQDAETSLKTLLGSTGAATRMMDDLRAVSDGTPLLFTEVLEGSQMLLGMGMNARKVRPTLMALNGAMIANGKGSEEFARATLAVSQMQAKGKASMEELLQLTEAGVPAIQLLSKEMGISGEQVMDLARSGRSAEEVIGALVRAMDKEYGAAAKEAAGNWTNQVAQMRKDWQQLRRVVTTPLFQHLNQKVMPRLSRAMRGATQAFADGVEKGGVRAGFDLMVRRTDYLIGAGGRMVKVWRPVMAAMAGFAEGWRAGGLFGALDSAVSRFDDAVGAGGRLRDAWMRLRGAGEHLWAIIRDGILPGLVDIWDAVQDLPTPLGAVSDVLGWLADNTHIVRRATLLLVGAWAVYRTAALITVGITKTWAAVQWALNGALWANPLGLVVLAAVSLAVGLWYLYQRSEAFRNAVQWLWDKLQGLFGWIAANWRLLLAILTGPIGAAVLLIAKHWGTIQSGAGQLIGWLRGAWGGVQEAIVAPFRAAWTAIEPILSKIEAALRRIASLTGGFGNRSAEVQERMERNAATGQGWRNVAGSGAGGAATPGSWTGSTVRRGGSLVVGERGRELVTLPQGAQIHRHSVTEQTLGQRAQELVAHLHVHLDGREIATQTVRHLVGAQARA